MKTLFVSVDFSPATRHVVATAADLAAELNAKLVLHHSLIPPMVTTEYGIGIEMLQETIALGEKSARHQLQHLEDELTARGLRVTTVLTSGTAAPHILEQAEKMRADTIVMGSHGHTALYDLLVGSTTHLVLHKAHCPVLIVPPGKAKAGRKKRATRS